MNLLSVRREVGEFKKRYKWMALVVTLVFLGLLGRMVQLQLVEYEHYASIALKNTTRTSSLKATRGLIRDRQGRVVALNRAAYQVYVTPQYLERGDLDRMASLLGLSESERDALVAKVKRVPARRRAHQIRVFSDIKRDQLAALETHQQDLCARRGSRSQPVRLPCLALVSEPVRVYPFGRLGAHAIGYLNEMTPEEYRGRKRRGYRLGERVGRTGVERAWEDYLRGAQGYSRVHVDARGRRRAAQAPRERRREPVPGRNLQLTIDMDLMRIIERAFRGYPSGSAAVVDVENGAVRALFSKPSYDLSSFSGGLSPAEYRELRDDPFRPLIDRTLYESYFPGSTFKPIAALAALADGVLDPDARVECAGSYTLGKTRFGCTSAHGEVDMRQAIVQSCNVYFYRLAEQVGLDRLARFARDFGLGEATGIGINTEAAGFIPTRAWYERVGRRFRLGYTLNNTIGQGDTKVTLIQLATAYAAIANGGRLYRPRLVERVLDANGETIEVFEPELRRKVQVGKEHLDFVKSGLVGVVNDNLGTAHDALLELSGSTPTSVAGKTGTAQVSVRARSHQDARRARYLSRAHAWFAGFAPAVRPRLAIVVLVEHGGPGGRYAAPIALRIVQEYLADSTLEMSAAAQASPAGAGS